VWYIVGILERGKYKTLHRHVNEECNERKMVLVDKMLSE